MDFNVGVLILEMITDFGVTVLGETEFFMEGDFVLGVLDLGERCFFFRDDFNFGVTALGENILLIAFDLGVSFLKETVGLGDTGLVFFAVLDPKMALEAF